MKKIAIIGGGAAGLAAAVCAAQHAGSTAQIVVFEAADRIGKSILVTGNGRCNFSNAELDSCDYHNADFVGESFAALPPQEVLEFFRSLGLMWHEEAQGRLYPLTNKATTMLDVLRFAAQDAGVEIRTGTRVHAITPNRAAQAANSLLVSCKDDSAEFFDAVIVACGGHIARSILPPNYSYINTRPLLAALKTNTDAIKGLNNIRVRCRLSGGGASELGEVLFRDYGISGIAAFDISRFVEPGDRVTLDFLPAHDEAQTEKLLVRRFENLEMRKALDFCAGILLPALARAVLKAAGIAPDKPIEHSSIKTLSHMMKNFPLEVLGIADYRQAQVQRGGFSVEDFDPRSMQSYADQGLFVVGEALDVDGPCGGYNLHWAWTSGILAGRAAAISDITSNGAICVP